MTDPKEASDTHSGADAREAARVSLPLRTAKLVCETGEYLCQIRDVSTLGVGLALLHVIPPEPRIILQLDSGRTYPVERVWTGKRQAGYRFGCEVSLDEFIGEEQSDEHGALRLNLTAPVTVIDGRDTVAAKITEIGIDGARIECGDTLPINSLLSFEFDGLPKSLGKVCWRDGGTYGVTFQHPLDLKELAQYALSTQPYAKPEPSRFAGMLAAARAA